MNTTNLRLDDCDTLCSSSIILSDKQTQTSIYLEDLKPSLPRPVPINYDNCRDKAEPKVFEVIEVIKDPNDSQSVTVIKDTFTEEVIDSSTPSHTSQSNRYKYCREVITPLLKSGSKECPSSLLRDELFNNVNEDEDPDYQPCDEVYDGAKDIRDKVGIEDNEDMDSTGCKTKPTNSSEPKKCLTINNDKNCTKKDKCPDCKKGSKESLKSLFSSERCQEKDVTCEKSKSECPKTDCKLKSCLSKCLQSSMNLAKTGSAACMKVIGIRPPKCPEDKPSYYVLEKPSETPSSTCSSSKSSMHRILDSQSGTLSSIKSAVQGFFGSVYKKTKDTVSLVTSESCKRLGLGQQTQSCATETASKSKTDLSQKSSKPTSCAYEQLGEESQLLGSVGRPSMEIFQPAIDVIGKLASKMESSVSYLNEFGIDKVISEHVESKMNRSSPYDKAPTPPRTISQELEPPPNSMFEMIKTKIYSIFHDEDHESEDENTDSDEDEKLFDKFCEQ